MEARSWILLLLRCVASFQVYTMDLHGDEDEITASGRSHSESSEQRLMHALVGDYDNSVRPVYDAMEAVDVNLGLTLTHILDLDEKNQVLTTNVWLEAEWFDERLNWSASDYGGLYAIRIPCEKLWLPDIVLYNSVDDYTSGYMPSLAMVYNTSRVFWGPVIRFRSSCKIDITFFPFDTQVCRLKLGSWAYTGLEVNVWNSSNTMDLSNFVDNGEWELLGVAVQRNIVFYNCCDEPFPDVTFSVQLRRRTKYYFMNIIIPCIILSFLCLGGFLLPPESGEKITLGLSVLLTITVFMLMVADKMPQTSESISVISIYLMVVLASSCLSVLSSVLVLSIHHQRSRPSRAPSWLRRFCFKVITPILCLRRHSNVPEPGKIVFTSGRSERRTFNPLEPTEPRFRKGMKIASIEDECERQRMEHADEVIVAASCATVDEGKFTRGSHTNHQVHTIGKQHADAYCLREKRLQASYTPLYEQRSNLNRRDHSSQQHTFTTGNLSDSSFSEVMEGCSRERPHGKAGETGKTTRGRSGVSQTYNLVVRYLISLIETRQDEEMRDDEVFKEWHDIAFVLDRLLFYLFFLITFLSTVCILEMRPPSQTI